MVIGQIVVIIFSCYLSLKHQLITKPRQQKEKKRLVIDFAGLIFCLNILKKKIKTDVDEFKRLTKNFSYYKFSV